MVDAILVHIDVEYLHSLNRGSSPRLGLYYIAEYANRHNISLKVKQYKSTEPIVENLVFLLKEYNCKVVGFYVDSENVWIIRRLIFPLKQLLPDLHIVVGGPQVTGDPQLVLKRIPDVDIAIVGEGERPFTELLNTDINNFTKICRIKGIALIDKDGNYFYSGDQPKLHIDEYPFPRRAEYALDSDIEFVEILTGRGCVGRCAFCFEGNKRRNNLRLRSLDNIIEEIDYIVSNIKDFKYISFLDDTFILNRERVIKICNHLINKYHGEVKWYCEARVDILIKNLDLLPIMKKAGLIRVQLGGESGSQRVLNAYNKCMQKEHLIQVVKAIYNEGIPSTYINFIIGGAFETLESFNETLELAKLLLREAPFCASVGCSLYTPYVGTPMRDNPDRYGIKIIDKESICGSDGSVPCVETTELTRQKIMQLRDFFNVDILKTQKKIVSKATKKDLYPLFYIKFKYGISLEWYDFCETISPINIYYQALIKYGFVSIDDIPSDKIELCTPYRTIQPFSDGESIYRYTFKNKKCSDLEEAVLMLSSGKLCFAEIIHLLKKCNRFTNVNSSIEEAVINIYKKFDKEFIVIWKTGY